MGILKNLAQASAHGADGASAHGADGASAHGAGGILGGLLMLVLGSCGRDFENPFLPGSTGYAGPSWTKDYDGDGIADSVAKYAPGCSDTPGQCLGRALAAARGNGTTPVASIAASDLALTLGQAKAPSVAILPPEASQSPYSLASRDTAVASIRDRLVVGSSLGTTKVTITALDGSGIKDEFIVSVRAEIIRVSAVAVEDMEFSLGRRDGSTDDSKEERRRRKPVVAWTPDNASDKGYSLASANPRVATTDGAWVKAAGRGKTTITLTTRDGSLQAVFRVTVGVPASRKIQKI